MLSPGLQGNPHGVEEVGGLGASIIGGRLRIGFQTFFQNLKNSDILYSTVIPKRSSHQNLLSSLSNLSAINFAEIHGSFFLPRFS